MVSVDQLYCSVVNDVKLDSVVAGEGLDCFVVPNEGEDFSVIPVDWLDCSVYPVDGLGCPEVAVE